MRVLSRAVYSVVGLLLLLTGRANATINTDPVLTFTYAGTTRDALVHVPKGYRPGYPIPLLISIHGGGGTALQQQKVSGFDTLAEPNNFIAVYPDSVGTDWSLTNAANGDVGFLTAIVSALAATGHAVDQAHMYLAGYSDGGYLAQLAMLCTPGEWAGIGIVASNFYPKMLTDCPVNPPMRKRVSVIMFHGEADPLNPYNGGKDISGRPVDSAAQTLSQYLTLDNCGPSLLTATITDQLNNGQQVFDTLQQATGCSGATLVQLYSIPGAGHTWPGSGMSPKATSANGIPLGPTSLDLKASSLIWAALKGH